MTPPGGSRVADWAVDCRGSTLTWTAAPSGWGLVGRRQWGAGGGGQLDVSGHCLVTLKQHKTSGTGTTTNQQIVNQ